MLHAPKLLLACLVFALFLSHSQATPVNLATYQISATVQGMGVPISEAEIEAFGAMWAKIGEIEAGLPLGHYIESIVIDSEGAINSTTYQISFHVNVEPGEVAGGGF